MPIVEAAKAALVLTVHAVMIGTLRWRLRRPMRRSGRGGAGGGDCADAQSFSVGGEYGAATALLIEQNPQQRGFLAIGNTPARR